MNIDDLTYGEMKKIVAAFAGQSATVTAPTTTTHDPMPVVICTDKRGVVFGYTTNHTARPIELTNARMCLYWSADVGGVFGLGEKGPTKDCKISATLPKITLEGVTAIFSVDAAAESAWKSAKVQGR